MSLRGKFDSEDLAITQEASFVNSADWSTTSTSWQDTDLTFLILIPDSHICLFAWAEMTVEHSVAGATFDVLISLTHDDSEVGQYSIAQKDGLYIAAASARIPVSLSAGYDVQANLPLVVTPGNRRMRLEVKNNTAGTLTLRGLHTLHAFVAGDATV